MSGNCTSEYWASYFFSDASAFFSDARLLRVVRCPACIWRRRLVSQKSRAPTVKQMSFRYAAFYFYYVSYAACAEN